MRGYVRKRVGKRGVSFQLFFDLGTDPRTGKRRQRCVTVRGTRAEADAKLRDILRQLDTGQFADPKKLTVGEYLQRWFATHKDNLAPSTVRRYEGIIKQHLVPTLGKALLAKLTPLRVQEFIAHELKEGRVDNKKTPGPSLSAASVRYEFQVLHKALKQAVEWQLIPRNPADFVKAPRGEKAELVVLTEEEVARLLDAVKESYLYMPTFLAIYTGMRLGEILGLRWQDVDLTRGQIHVNQANCQRKVGEPQFKKPKTAKGRRVIDISASVVQTLKAHKKQQAKWRLAAGSAWQDFGLVCCLQDGRPMNPPNVSSHFADVTARLGLPVTFHGLRHTHASLLLKAGVPAKVISERLGHSTIAVTMDVYASVMPGMQREAANKLEDLLRSL